MDITAPIIPLLCASFLAPAGTGPPHPDVVCPLTPASISAPGSTTPSVEPAAPADRDDFGAVGYTYVGLVAGWGASPNSAGRHRISGGVSVDHFRWESVSLGAEVTGVRFEREGRDTSGASASLTTRWHPARGAVGSLYLEAGGGGVATQDPVPGRGTRFNFSSQAGLGLTIRPGKKAILTTGLRWNHISNASIRRPNPGRDTIYGHLSLSIRLGR